MVQSTTSFGHAVISEDDIGLEITLEKA